MKARWAALAAKFAAMQPRERASVAVAAAFVIGMGGYTVWIDPAQQRAAILQKQVAKDKGELQSLQAQVAGLRAQLKDPDEPNRKELAAVKAETTSVEQSLHAFDNVLVPPERAPQLLQSLFAHHRGLELVGLQTLPATPLLTPPSAKADAKPDAKAPATPPARGENIQKHPIEIRMAGGYADLLAYVAELEQLPHKLLWDSMALTVQKYPRSELTLVVSTLSLDSVWLVF